MIAGTTMDKKAASGYYDEPPTFSAGSSSVQRSQSLRSDALPNSEDLGDVPKYTEHAFDNVYIPPGGEEPPPAFTPYEAEFFVSGDSIVSHDPHLNQDGEALYRFLLSQSTTPPEYRIQVRGTHTEHKTRIVNRRNNNGSGTTSKTEHYTETVTDFDFYLDLTPNIVYGPVHWSVPDAEPAYRGEMYKQIDSNDLIIGDPEVAQPSDRRKATRGEMKAGKERKGIREAYGLPPWVAVSPESPWLSQTSTPMPTSPVVLQSSQDLRQWADEYCTSDKLLKEFVYTKVVYGWHIENLKQSIAAAVRSVYSHDVFVIFHMSQNKICIRPDNKFSRMLSNGWIKFLLWILLIYPFIWLYKRFSHRGGGRWEVCGGAYALKTWQQQPPGTAMPPYNSDGRWQQTPDGVVHLIGEREGEWFQRWEGTIRGAVKRRVQSRTPLECGAYVPEPVLRLDGIRPIAAFLQSPFRS